MKRISSRDNPLIKEAIKLKQKKYRQETGMFIIEGERMLSEALQKPEMLVRVFLNDAYSVPASLQAAGIECVQVDPVIFKALADTEHPQGVAAVLRIPEYQPDQLLQQPLNLFLLDRIADPGNLGTIIRTAWAMDVDALLLTPGCVDPFSPKVVRSTMGGILHVPIFWTDVNQIDQLMNHGYRVIAATPGAPSSIYEIEWEGPTICVIGSEAHGVEENWLQRAAHRAVIPINPRVDSLNAAVSCAIIMSVARRGKKTHP